MPKPTKTSASTLKPSALLSVPPVVQAEYKTMGAWLHATAEHRKHRPLPDRLEALLWSWPIRLGFSTRPPNQLWPGTKDNKETGQRKAAILTVLARLARTVYSETIYPETDFFDTWAPHDWPSTMDDGDFKDMCRDLCDQLRTLSGVMVHDPHNDRLWLTALLEFGWGDGHLADRRELQNSVVNGLSERVRRQACEVGEWARDAAYREVRVNRSLDALNHTKEQAQAAREWLLDEKRHVPFLKEHLPERFSREFHPAVDRMTKAVDFYMENASKGRSRRPTAGQKPRPWVDKARRDLKNLHLSEPRHRDLLIAWSIIPLPPLL